MKKFVNLKGLDSLQTKSLIFSPMNDKNVKTKRDLWLMLIHTLYVISAVVNQSVSHDDFIVWLAIEFRPDHTKPRTKPEPLELTPRLDTPNHKVVLTKNQIHPCWSKNHNVHFNEPRPREWNSLNI